MVIILSSAFHAPSLASSILQDDISDAGWFRKATSSEVYGFLRPPNNWQCNSDYFDKDGHFVSIRSVSVFILTFLKMNKEDVSSSAWLAIWRHQASEERIWAICSIENCVLFRMLCHLKHIYIWRYEYVLLKQIKSFTHGKFAIDALSGKCLSEKNTPTAKTAFPVSHYKTGNVQMELFP